MQNVHFFGATSSKPEESMETLSAEEIVVVVLGPIAAELLRSTDDKLLEAANDACEADEADEAMAMAEADDGGVLIVRST